MPVKSKRKHTIPMTNADCAVCDATNSSAEDTPSPRLTRMLLGTVENRISNARKWPIVVKKRIATRYSLIIFVQGVACKQPDRRQGAVERQSLTFEETEGKFQKLQNRLVGIGYVDP